MNSSLAVEGEITPSMSFDETATLSEEVGNARSSLHAAIEARKQTERDAQLLLNRIQLLRNEEAKALKNVAVTRTKVNQISSVKRDAAAREAEMKPPMELPTTTTGRLTTSTTNSLRKSSHSV